MNTQIKKLKPQNLADFGAEMDAIRDRVLADLGQRDADYIRSIVQKQRRLEMAGRGLLFFSFIPPAWLGGVAALSAAKILDNMEIGHNVMHGQYDWMNDPALSSKKFEWDTACPSDQWRHSHNYMHHTYTNVQKVDRDIGYGVLRMSEEQPWQPYYFLNPLWATLLALFFQYGVALHDLEVENLRNGKMDRKKARRLAKAIAKKTGNQSLKDYAVFPLLAGPMAPLVFLGNASANLARNLWTFTIVFCGHFPDGVQQFTQEEAKDESRGAWYYRQLLGSANLTGGKTFHVMSGHLSHQIEHHLFPGLPAHRYPEIAPQVRTICEKYGLPYNQGPLRKQFATVVRRIVRLALPNSGPRKNQPVGDNALPSAA